MVQGTSASTGADAPGARDNGPKPSATNHPCHGYLCDCEAFQKAGSTSGGYPYCQCQHTDLVHRPMSDDQRRIRRGN